MNTVKDYDHDTVYKAPGRSTIHLTPDCPAFSEANTVQSWSAEQYRDRPVCQRCDPRHEIDYTPAGRDFCRECDSRLDENGECGFCERFDAVMARAPDASEYSSPEAFMRAVVVDANGDVS